MRNKGLFLGIFFLLLVGHGIHAQPVKLTNVFSVNVPFNVEFIPVPNRAGKVAIAGQSGYVRLYDLNNPTAQPDTILDLTRETKYSYATGELGLLGLAFHPWFPAVNKVYVNYTNNATGNPLASVIAEFTVDTATLKAPYTTEKRILSYWQPAANHNGGKIQFGPDSMLYIATGDGGGGGDPYKNGQKDTTLLGKILRIDILHNGPGKAYGIPNDNPYANSAFPVKREIYCKGLRNPWRFSWDFEAKRLWVADVGQKAFEEIDTVKSGGNYGWNYREGDSCYTPVRCVDTTLINPVYFYPHKNGNQSITGGYVYRGNSIWWLKGKYIFADYATGNIWALRLLPDSGVHVQFLIRAPFTIPTFGEDAEKELYVLGYLTGKVFKITSDSLYVPTSKVLLTAVRISPNPAKDFIDFELSVPLASRFSVELVTLAGQAYSLTKEVSSSPGATKLTYYVGHLPKGSYVLQIKSEREQYSKRVILE